MTENYANEYQTVLDGGIDDSVTSLDVTSASGSPDVNFRIRIDDELMLVTNKSGVTFTVTRGVEGTAAASHANGADVTHVLTAEGLTTGIPDYAVAQEGTLVQEGDSAVNATSPKSITLAHPRRSTRTL